MAERGFRWAVYVTDDGATYARLVARDAVNDPNRGWTTAGVEGAAVWPLMSKPRMVYGISPSSGRRNHTIVAQLAAPLWQGSATSWVAETDDPNDPFDTYVVTRRRGESMARPHSVVVS